MIIIVTIIFFPIQNNPKETIIVLKNTNFQKNNTLNLTYYQNNQNITIKIKSPM